MSRQKLGPFLQSSKFKLTFFLCTNVLKYYQFKMMDQYQLEQKLCNLLKICPIFVGSNIFECFDLTSFFFIKKALKYYRFKMMDRYQLEQKSSRDMWQLGLDIYKNWLRLTKLCHDAWPIYLVLLWFTLWIIEFVSPT